MHLAAAAISKYPTSKNSPFDHQHRSLFTVTTHPCKLNTKSNLSLDDKDTQGFLLVPRMRQLFSTSASQGDSRQCASLHSTQAGPPSRTA